MIRRLFPIALVSGVAFVGLNCADDSDGPAPGSSTDAGALDVARTDAPVLVDAGTDVFDAADAAVQDASTVDATADAPADASDASDANVAVDADLGFDDAGCPILGATSVDAADAGLPPSGLVLWLRADKALATVDGGAICRWGDLSGNDHAFAPATASPPVLSATGLNGKPAVSFPASGRHLVRSDVLGIGATSARTVAVYGATQDTTHRFQYWHQGKGGTPGTYFGLDQNTYNTAGSREGAYVTNNGYDSTLATSTNPRTHVLSISSFTSGTTLPAALVYAVDGTVLTLTRTSGGLGNGTVEDFSTADFTTIGTASAGFTGALLGEVLVYDRALTTPERTAVEQYFTSRFQP